MRMSGFEICVLVLAVSGAAASCWLGLVVAETSWPPHPRELSLRDDAAVAHARGAHPSVEMKSDVATTSQRIEAGSSYACRFENGAAVPPGAILHENHTLGAVVRPGEAILHAALDEGAALEIEIGEHQRIPAIFESAAIRARAGFFVTGTVGDEGVAEGVPEGLVRGECVVSSGRIDPRDRSDLELARLAGGGAIDDTDLLVFSPIARFDCELGAVFGPYFVACASAPEAFELSVAIGGRVGRVRLPSDFAPGTLQDVGRVQLEVQATLEIVVENASDLALEVTLARVPDDAGVVAADHALGRHPERLFAALHHGVPLPLDPAAPRLVLAPIDEGAIDVVLRRSDGVRLDARRIDVGTSRPARLVLDASPLSRVRTLELTLQFVPDGAAICNASVVLSDLCGAMRVTGRTDESGVSRLPLPLAEGLDAGRGHEFAGWFVRVEGFDPAAAERSFLVEAPASALLAGEFTVSIPRLRTLRAVGLAPPPGAPRTAPLAYRLERARPGEDFVPVAAERFEVDSDTVTVSCVESDVRLRVTAIYSAVFLFASEFVAMGEGDSEVVTSFATLESMPRFQRGRVVDVEGRGIGGMLVEATCGAAVPPEIVVSDGDGRFVIGPIVAPEIEVAASDRVSIARAPYEGELILRVPESAR